MNTPTKATTIKKSGNATARVTLLVTPAEKEALAKKANEKGFDSVGEYLRRKAFNHDRDLDVLAELVRESTARAVETVNRSLALVEGLASGAATRDEQVRTEAAKEFASWSTEQQRAVSGLFGDGKADAL